MPLKVAMAFVVCLSFAAVSCVKGGSPGASPVAVKRTQMHMGTLVSITAVGRTQAEANAAITAGFEEVKRLEQLLSTWIPESELSRVNAAAGRSAVMVSAETMTVVRKSLQVAEMTEGAFNIAIGPAVDAWNISAEPRLPTAEELAALKPLVDLQYVHTDVWERTIHLQKPGMRIDVGGIGKGYAADQAVSVMKKAGAVAGVVALSGDIKTFGRLPDGASFPVGIRHPQEGGRNLSGGHICKTRPFPPPAITNGSLKKTVFGITTFWIPTRLHPARGCQSVSVIAKEGIWADGLDTGIFVLGARRGMELVEQLEDVEAIIVDDGGRVLISSGLRDRVVLTSDH